MTVRTSLFSFVFLFAFFLFAGICSAQPPPVAVVVVAKVTEKEIKKPVVLAATAHPDRKSVVPSEVEGVLRSFVAEEGQYVKKGEVLARIGNEKIGHSLEELKNQRNEASAAYKLSDKEFRRAKDLYEKGVVSEGELDRAAALRDSSRAALARLEAAVRKAEYDFAAAEIRAPFNGYVTEYHAEEGQWVKEGGDVLSLVDIDTVEVTAGLPERYLADVKPGDEVEVVVGSLDRRVFSGKISSVVPHADLRARVFPVKAILDNREHLIKSFVSAEMRIRIGESGKIKLLPKDAIVNSPGGTIVFAVRKGVVHPVPVRRVGWYGGDAHVEGPVSPGEDVVIRGNERLQPMQKVRIVESVGQ